MITATIHESDGRAPREGEATPGPSLAGRPRASRRRHIRALSDGEEQADRDDHHRIWA